MLCSKSVYTLPQIDFVGGSTQDLVFHIYHCQGKKAHDMSFCTADFAVINYVNRDGKPLISKKMDIRADPDRDGETNNVLSVTLDPGDTVGLPDGKYIYQISIKDIGGDVEIPNRGIIYIIHNIHQSFVM